MNVSVGFVIVVVVVVCVVVVVVCVVVVVVVVDKLVTTNEIMSCSELLPEDIEWRATREFRIEIPTQDQFMTRMVVYDFRKHSNCFNRFS